jgi:hypothetical protein
LLASNNANAATGSPICKTKAGIKKPVINEEYYFLLMGDGCFHLARLNPPGYIDQYGNYFEGYSLTFVSSQDYEGTVSICPSDGNAYC